MTISRMLVISLSFACITACTTPESKLVVNQDFIQPGTKVIAGGKEAELYPGKLQVGDNFLEKAGSLGIKFTNQTTLVNIVPSIDTAVCEEQTHILSESTALKPTVARMLISRDLPQAQRRFALESGLENISYYSDYKEGAFGKASGLLIKGPELLARGVLVLDKSGIVRYMQIVSRLDQLPDMNKAIDFANKLEN